MRAGPGSAPPAQVARPRPPQGLIWRPRLAETLDRGTRQAVTLICAGPGWGKTALASAWAGARAVSGPIAWLTCAADHNDPYTFWSDLLLALRTSGAVRPGQSVPQRGPVVPAEGPDFLRRLGSGLAALPGPVVVVLDDLQEITDQRILVGLSGLLRHPPDRLRLVLISRTDPDLSLHRLRTAGELTEIRARDLAFGVEEAAELLAARGRRLSAVDLAALVRATEGWGAGLRLAMDAPAGVGPDEASADYLVREVLAAQPTPVRDFLLGTSVPDRINGSLAEAVTGRPGEQLLARLERANLFIERVGGHGWYRYHRQFRAALRGQLARECEDVAARVHLLAAQWHAGRDNPLAALHHAAAAGDWQLVTRLLVDHGLALFVSPDRVELIDLMRRIPLARLPETAESTLCLVMLRYGLGDLSGLARGIDRVRELLRERGHGGRELIATVLDLFEAALVIRWRGDMPRLVTTTTGVLTDLARLHRDEAPAVLRYRAMALLNKGIGLLWTNRLDHADRYLWAAATGARAAGIPLVEVNALGHLALLALIQGSLREAGEHADAALGVARRIDAEDRFSVTPAYVVRASLDLWQGAEPEAEEALRRALHSSGEQPETAMTVLMAVFRAYLLIDRGEPRTARTVLATLAAEAGPALRAPMLDRIVELAHSEVDLALGDPRPVLTRYAHRDGLYPPEQLLLAHARQLTGRTAEAEELLALLRDGPDRVAAVSAWLLTALAADAQGRGQRAGEALGQALAAAEPIGIRRPFRRFDNARVLALAERQQWLTEPRGRVGEGVLAEITGEIPIGTPPTAGPLSEREIDVLQYLPTVLTAGEIAENLGISVNTVKAHMRSIYRKLGAGRRREAVVIARQLGLL
ncbi:MULTISPECIES: LuxR C-terminal-related transcriptional regulator [unclassified Actinoplanes]|uniref:helix-turn-helix transcriptional regulator n=1 Tax=unclassified Actinoplanes TaxID=2626549 RepID=UPI00043A356C|nr:MULTISPECIES: LuxR C-terminal-related transcriptional regulator [unclassified Actinoplanes]